MGKGSPAAVTSDGWGACGSILAILLMRDIITCRTSESEDPESSIISVATFPISPGIRVTCFLTAATTTVGGLSDCWDACCPSQTSLSRFPDGDNLSLDVQIDHTHDKAQRLIFAVGGEMGNYAVHAQHHHNRSSVIGKHLLTFQ